MMPVMNNNRKKSKIQIASKLSKRGKNILGAILIIFTAIVVVFLILDFSLRQDHSKIYKEAQRIDKEVMLPLGASKNTKLVSRGDGLWEKINCGPDIDCPEAEQSWVIPIEPGQEQSLLTSIADKAGYEVEPTSVGECSIKERDGTCLMKLTKNSMELTLSLAAADSFHHKLPEKDISPKVWRYIRIILNP